MGAGQSDLYKGTYGDTLANIPDCLKGKIKMPSNDAQIKHIMADREGHLPDSPENRKLLVELANNIDHFRGIDKWGNNWHIRMNGDGSQDWTRSMNMVINEGGRNAIPKPWDDSTGLYRNIWRQK